ncbi:MAG: ExbD/TolR family protein [Polyangiales bacterium]
MSSPQADEDGIVGINVTPLVDITLVLLVVFMVCAKLIAGQAVPLDLPKAATAGETQTMLTVTIERDGKVSIDGHSIDSDDKLRQAGRAALTRSHDLRTVVQASSAASHGSVLHVVDELRQVGITKIAFAAERP